MPVELSDAEVFGTAPAAKELSDAEVFGTPREMSDAEVFGKPNTSTSTGKAEFHPAGTDTDRLATALEKPALETTRQLGSTAILNKPILEATPTGGKFFGFGGDDPEKVAEVKRIQEEGLPIEKAALGLRQGADEFLSGLTSPLSLGTLGLAGILKGAPAVSRALSAWFAVHTGKELAVDTAQALGEEYGKPESERDPAKLGRLWTGAALSAPLTAALGTHALRGEAAPLITPEGPTRAEHLATLGLEPDATPEDIKSAFRDLAKQYHPDVAGNTPEANARFQDILNAYTAVMPPKPQGTPEPPKSPEVKVAEENNLPVTAEVLRETANTKEVSRNDQTQQGQEKVKEDVLGTTGAGAAAVKTAAPVPEQASSIAKQLEVTLDPQSTKAVTLITPGSPLPMDLSPEHFSQLGFVDTKHGTAIYNPAKTTREAVLAAAEGKDFDGTLLGMSQSAKPEPVGNTVVQTTKDGVPVLDEVVPPTPAAIAAASAAHANAVPGGETTVKPAEDVLAERTSNVQLPTSNVELNAPKTPTTAAAETVAPAGTLPAETGAVAGQPAPVAGQVGVAQVPKEVATLKISKVQDELRRWMKGQPAIGKLDADAKREWLKEHGVESHDTGRKLRYTYHLSDGRVVSADGALKFTNPKAYERIKARYDDLNSQNARKEMFTALPEEVRRQIVNDLPYGEIAQLDPDSHTAVNKYLKAEGHILSGIWSNVGKETYLTIGNRVANIQSALASKFTDAKKSEEAWRKINRGDKGSELVTLEREGKFVTTIAGSDKAKTIEAAGWKPVESGAEVDSSKPATFVVSGTESQASTSPAGNSSAHDALTLKPINAFAVKPKEFVGEFRDAKGEYVGDLHKVGENDFRVRKVEYGNVTAESRPLKQSEITRAGAQSVSGSQTVRFFKLAGQPTAETAVAVQEEKDQPPVSKQTQAPGALEPKDQKKFLLSEVEKAIADAPDQPVRNPSESDADLEQLNAARKAATPNEYGPTDKKLAARNADELFKKYNIPEESPASERYKNLLGQPVQDKAGGPYPAGDRLKLLEQAIEAERFKALEKVTIDIPGDGTFSIINSKPVLKDFQERAKKFPVKATTRTEAPRARTEASQPPKVETNRTFASDLKTVREFTSQDATRVIGYVYSDGKQLIATDGRRLMVVQRQSGQGTTKNPALLKENGTRETNWGKDEKGKPNPPLKFPDYRQVIPETGKPLYEGVDTARLFSLLKQAISVKDMAKSPTVYLHVDKDGRVGITAEAPDVGEYASGITETSKPVMALNAQYLLDAVIAARRLGSEKVDFSYTDELAPLVMTGKDFKYVVMPMRMDSHEMGRRAAFDSAGSGKVAAAGASAMSKAAEKPKLTKESTKVDEEPPADSGDVMGFGGSKKKAATAEAVPVATTPEALAELQTKQTPGLGVVAQTKAGIQSLLLPSAKSPEHLRAAEDLGAKLGAMNRRAEAAAFQLRPASKMFDRLGVHNENLSPEKNPGIQFMSDLSQGRELSPEFKAAGALVQKLFAERLEKLEAAGAPLQTVRENYFPGMWTQESRLAFNAALEQAVQEGIIKEGFDVNDATAEQKQWVKERVDEMLENGTGSDKDMLSYLTRTPMKGKESFRKQKVFEDIMTAAQFGLRPISNNPIDLVKGKLAEMDKSIMANEFFQHLKGDGRLQIVNPYEEVPDGWVKINDKYGTIYGPPTVKVSEHLDKTVYDGLLDVAKNLGIAHERLMRFPPGQGSRALGLSYQGQNKILSRFGTETSVIAHEIGHQLDIKYGLWDRLTGGERGNERKSQIQKDLRAIADLTERGLNARSKEEKIAQVLEAYVHAPEKMREVAPTVFKKFDDFIRGTQELKPLSEIKPGLALKELTGEKYVGLPIIGYRIVPEAVGDITNNYLSSSLYNNKYFGGLYKAWMASANALNQTQLGVGSAFHAGFTTGEVQISAGANVLKDAYGLLRGNRSGAEIGNTLKTWAKSAVATAVTGDKVLNAWRNPDGVIDPRIAQVVKATELAGGGYKLESGLATEQTVKMVRDWFSGHKLKAAARSPVALTEILAKPIMDYLVPRQKAGVFSEIAWRIIEQNPDKSLEELTPEFRQAWNRVDARLGQVRYNRLFTNNAAKNIVQGLVRAPGWTGGTIAELGGAFPDAYRFFKEWQETGKPPEELPDRTAYLISLLLTAGIINAALTYLFTREIPHGMDFFAFRSGGKDEHGNDERFLLPSYMKDILAYARHPSDTLVNKSHPWIDVVSEVARNRDYYGYEIRNPHANSLVQGGQVAKYVIKSFEPFWTRGVRKVIEGRDRFEAHAKSQAADAALAKEFPELHLPTPSMTAEKKPGAAELVAPFFGVMPATANITRTPMQNKIAELYHLRTGDRTKPYDSKDTDAEKLQHRNAGMLDVYMFKRLPKSDKEALAKKMTDAEKARYGDWSKK